MNTARKIENQNFKVVKGNKGFNKHIDRFFAFVLLLIGLLVSIVERDVSVLIVLLFVSLPLVFSKKRFVQL